ncbi:arsenic transporter [Anaerocolumna cellulosilytica]|uniref:Arsenic transporter n=1 Tax=Anaerocolumna cellulosilytica TaxID=433286 RepID=A0A6S6R170_9FIRM|nr:SLC13 family permease [Anaerocolumna cellulosilytica]MBB5196802.1 Na+/H+ antiporter NhaD/arsenite permease-like protein [Anaerocolumna cellulosilytica]BCJ95806.1 arsenic transporter [Anaerocolumna cellulosilytica]
MKTTALILFALTYVLLLSLPKLRAYIALASAAIFVALGILPVEKIFVTVDWNVIMMIAGTMGVVSLFIESKMPSLLADFIIEKTPNVKWAIVSLALFAGIISAFVDNVATVLMVAPVALTIAKKLNISPVSSVIAISIASNLQGAATLVGDTTSILLGGYADMNFMDFFFFKGRLGIFWIVEIGAFVSTLVLLFIFRKDKEPVKAMERTKVTDFFPTVLLCSIVALLIIASFIENKPSITNGLICMVLFAIGITRKLFITRNINTLTDAIKEIDFQTILLLTGLFVVIGGITEAGIVSDISKLFVKASDNVFVIFTLIVWASVLFSAFIDNIPYVATMLPVTAQIAGILQIDPYILYFGLLIGSTLGGNITPIGASANITGIGILRKEGYEVSAGQFMKMSIPFTLSAVICGYILIWLIWR